MLRDKIENLPKMWLAETASIPINLIISRLKSALHLPCLPTDVVRIRKELVTKELACNA